MGRSSAFIRHRYGQAEQGWLRLRRLRALLHRARLSLKLRLTGGRPHADPAYLAMVWQDAYFAHLLQLRSEAASPGRPALHPLGDDPAPERRPTLSIVTVNLNDAAGVARTVASLRPVAHRDDVEFIFVDGQSRDESVAIARGFYACGRLLSERDRGVYEAMNKGLRMATGRYVVWINSGDELLPDALPRAIAVLESEDADLACFGIQAVSRDGATVRELLSEVHALPRTILHHQGACFRREALVAMGGYDEAYRIVGDQDLIQRMFRAGRKITSHPLILSRFHEDGLSFTRGRFVEECAMQRKFGLISRSRQVRLLAELWLGDPAKPLKQWVHRWKNRGGALDGGGSAVTK